MTRKILLMMVGRYAPLVYHIGQQHARDAANQFNPPTTCRRGTANIGRLPQTSPPWILQMLRHRPCCCYCCCCHHGAATAAAHACCCPGSLLLLLTLGASVKESWPGGMVMAVWPSTSTPASYCRRSGVYSNCSAAAAQTWRMPKGGFKRCGLHSSQRHPC